MPMGMLQQFIRVQGIPNAELMQSAVQWGIVRIAISSFHSIHFDLISASNFHSNPFTHSSFKLQLIEYKVIPWEREVWKKENQNKKNKSKHYIF